MLRIALAIAVLCAVIVPAFVPVFAAEQAPAMAAEAGPNDIAATLHVSCPKCGETFFAPYIGQQAPAKPVGDCSDCQTCKGKACLFPKLQANRQAKAACPCSCADCTCNQQQSAAVGPVRRGVRSLFQPVRSWRARGGLFQGRGLFGRRGGCCG